MYYTDKEHTYNTIFTIDKLNWKDREFKSNQDFENDLFKMEEEIHDIPQQIMEYKIQYIGREIQIPKQYQEEEFMQRDYGDTEFYKWLKTQHDVSIAILAEIVHSPKLGKKIEDLRANVKNIDTISIDEYRKIKCIGSSKVAWLKQLKKKYGINILRFLKMSISN